ncbi:MAG: tRNA lysidine(34) synthetase TilS [Pelovirga sp.]
MSNCLLESAVLQSLPEHCDTLIVAVSGGVDSVVLLHLLDRIARSRSDRPPLNLQAFHLNHQIRSEAAADARFVSNLCRQLNIPCHSVSRDVPALAKMEKVSLEMAGRKVRRELLQRLADQQGADLIALGHHRDDQVETFVLRLTRGSGLSGLAAMAERDGIWWRPLLNCSRRQIRDYARQQQLDWREDASNQDPTFVRNTLRMQVVPLLEKINPRLDERITELSRQIASEEDYWQRQLQETFPLMVVATQDGLRLSRIRLLDCHRALRLRLLREAVRQVCGHLEGVEAIHLRAISDLLDGPRSQAQLDLPGCWVARRYNHLWLRNDPPDPPVPFDLPVQIPGETYLPDGRKLVVTLVERPQAETRESVCFDLDASGSVMSLRNWQPGDRFAPLGMSGRKRLKRLFSDLHIEKEDRYRVPLLFSGRKLLWVVGVQRSRHAVAGLSSGRTARFELVCSD